MSVPLPPARTGGQILIQALCQQQVRHVFCVPGESYLSALDALHDTADITTVVCRHEGGAAMMAEARGKLTGHPGVCFVTRGPGATNAASGIHVAAQDSTPLVLLIGQVSRDALGREAFQEIDYGLFYNALAKHVEQVHDVARLPEVMSRAFHTACNGRPGPVVVVLPEDVLTDSAQVGDLPAYHRLHSEPASADMARFATLLANAHQPVLLAGGRNWSPASRTALHEFAQRWQLPVTAPFRYQDVFDNTDAQYVGDVGIGMNPQLESALTESDLVIALGVRLGEVTTRNYTRLRVPLPYQQLVHVYPGVEELGRVYYPTLAFPVSAPVFALALSALQPPAQLPWAAHGRELRDSYLRWTTPADTPDAVNLAKVVAHLSETLADDAIVCAGAGNNTGWLHRYFRHRGTGRQLASTSGSMGYGIPAAVAAALVFPKRQVICVVGDGDFQMTGQEIATAVQYELSIVIIVVNNAMLGTIRMHQEMRYPGRISHTDLSNPDFCALAAAHGLGSERVSTTDGFAPALQRALAAPSSTLIELITDAEAIAHTTTLTKLRARSSL